MQWLGVLWMSSRISYANFKGIGALAELSLVAIAPLVSAVGAVLAGRIYFLARAGNSAERQHLTAKSGTCCYGEDGGPAASQQCENFSWPADTAPRLPPLSGGDAEVTRSPPFRAIFGTPLPKSPRSALAEKTAFFNHDDQETGVL